MLLRLRKNGQKKKRASALSLDTGAVFTGTERGNLKHGELFFHAVGDGYT